MPRGELQAIVHSLRTAPADKHVEFHPDATYTAKGMVADPPLASKLRTGSNADLW